MRTTQLFVVIFFWVTTPGYAGFLSWPHTATLMLGQGRGEILTQAEHVVGDPIKTDHMSGEEAGEVELCYYEFTDEYNIVLIFYQDIFYQLFVQEKDPDDMPFITDMSYQLRGFLITKKGKEIDLQLLGRPNVPVSSGMLMIKSLDIAWERFREGKYPDARMIASKVSQQYPDNSRALNLLGNIDLRENDLESSIGWFKKALEVGDGQEEYGRDYILNNLAMVYFKAGQYDEALQTFEQSIAVASDLNCAGRLGNLLTLISLDEVDQAKETIAPCQDFSESKRALENLFEYFNLSNDALKEKALMSLPGGVTE